MKTTRTIRCTFVCVCVCVCVCVYSGLELGMCGTVWRRSSVLTRHKQKFLPFAGDKETQMVKCHADSKVEDSKLARLSFYFCVTFEILVTVFVKY